MKEGFVKAAFSDSDGVQGLLLHGSNKVIIFNSSHCSKIKGLDEDVSCWIGNNLRVYTPVKYTIYGETVVLNFYLEKIEITAERIHNVPDFVKEHKYEAER